MGMKSLSVEQATLLEQEIGLITAEIAQELVKPFSLRDVTVVHSTWDQIKSYREEMQFLCKTLAKIKRPTRKDFPVRSEFDVKQAEYKSARSIMKRQNMWSQIERLVKRHIAPKKVPLIYQPDPNPYDPLLLLIDRAFHRLANSNDQSHSATDLNCFADIVMPIQRYEILLTAANRVCTVLNRTEPQRFVDVGCGGGTRVFVASRYFPYADGFDYDMGYVEAGQQTMKAIGASHSEIFYANALTYDGYKDYDIIYFYRPLRDEVLLAEMQQHIIRTARPGTILIAPYDSVYSTHKEMNCAQIDGPIFMTGVTQDQADLIREDAELVSSQIIDRSDAFSFDTGHWAAILDAASWN